ncbi:MAG: phytanoyl-CoA dioxygenase family protein [Pelagimonas sp.]|uniref:phytanoyl-CoA dioxygenase family protein n=1 Tax=Pelagimonas sp. TaxID=2073170 RepID=UPI003D6B8E09
MTPVKPVVEHPIWVRQALHKTEIAPLKDLAERSGRPGQRFGPRSELAQSLAQSALLQNLRRICPKADVTRVVGFDKTDRHNWVTPWHQDRVIAVSDKHDLPGYENWSQKSGIWHCEPPETILRSMLFTRLFLDDVGPDNGGMEYAKGSHMSGCVAASDAEKTALQYETEIETGTAGDLLILPMLTLHRSRPAKQPGHRAVLRIDCATQPLPAPLSWLSWERE